MTKLNELIFSVTNRCNLRCKMCDIPYEVIDELTFNELKKVIEEASSLGFSTFVFSGGEPLIRKDIFELIAFVREVGMSACVTSNGCLITDEVAAKLASSDVRVVNISIEGDRRTHDYLRGEGSYDLAIAGLKNLSKYKVETTIATMVSKYNYECLPSLVDLARELGATTIRFQPFSGIFIADKNREKDFFISIKDEDRCRKVMEEVIKLCNSYHISTNPCDYLMMIPSYLSGKMVLTKRGCSVLWSMCSVNAKGDVWPCWVMTDSVNLIGNVKSGGLLKLWRSARHKKILNTIVKNGCPGCMMSCYDDVFGQDNLKDVLARKVRKVGNVRSYQRLFNRVAIRYRFYNSYRGGVGRIINRIIQKILRKGKLKPNNEENNLAAVLLEINQVKEKLKAEKGTYK